MQLCVCVNACYSSNFDNTQAYTLERFDAVISYNMVMSKFDKPINVTFVYL